MFDLISLLSLAPSVGVYEDLTIDNSQMTAHLIDSNDESNRLKYVDCASDT